MAGHRSLSTTQRYVHFLGEDLDTATRDAAWVTDVTNIATGEGWLYLAVTVDLFSRRVVGWAAVEIARRAYFPALARHSRSSTTFVIAYLFRGVQEKAQLCSGRCSASWRGGRWH